MADITYQVVPHDNGWAYKLGDALLAYPAPDGRGWAFQELETDKSNGRL